MIFLFENISIPTINNTQNRKVYKFHFSLSLSSFIVHVCKLDELWPFHIPETNMSI